MQDRALTLLLTLLTALSCWEVRPLPLLLLSFALLCWLKGDPTPARAQARAAPAAVSVSGPALSSGELLGALDEARLHVREERLVEAARLVARVRRALKDAPGAPGTDAARAAQVLATEEARPGLSWDTLLQHAAAAEAALIAIEDRSGWKVMAEKVNTQTAVRRADGLVWFKVDSTLDVPLEYLIAVFRETDHYRVWYPNCQSSQRLWTAGRVEQVFRMVQQVSSNSRAGA